MNPFEMSGHWIKANLHAHTTNSDGLLSPKDVVKFYKQRGYKVISITDHEKVTRIRDKELIIIPGSEVAIETTSLNSSYHLVILGLEDIGFIDKKVMNANDVILEASKLGGLVILAHPYWSGLTFDDVLNLKGIIGIEVYNGTCDAEVGKGFSTIYWDMLLSNKKNIFGLAVDDAHRYYIPFADGELGWIFIKAKKINQEEVLKSIRNGLFYSSTGPVIHHFKVSKEEVHIKVSESKVVNFISFNGHGFSISYSNIKEILKPENRSNFSLEVLEDHVIRFRYRRHYSVELSYTNLGIKSVKISPLKFAKKYIRAEIIDKNGKYAWTNPIFLD